MFPILSCPEVETFDRPTLFDQVWRLSERHLRSVMLANLRPNDVLVWWGQGSSPTILERVTWVGDCYESYNGKIHRDFHVVTVGHEEDGTTCVSLPIQTRYNVYRHAHRLMEMGDGRVVCRGCSYETHEDDLF